MKLNERIKELRINNKMTSKEFGSLFDISESSVSLYENGKRKPNLELIIDMANYFSVTTDYIFGLSDSLINNNENVQHDLEKFLKNLIKEIEHKDSFTIDNKIIDNQFKIVIIKMLSNVNDTIYFFSKEYKIFWFVNLIDK